jgi:hypothetical protein
MFSDEDETDCTPVFSLDEDEDERDYITLVTQDGKTYSIDWKTAQWSGYIRNCLENDKSIKNGFTIHIMEDSEFIKPLLEFDRYCQANTDKYYNENNISEEERSKKRNILDLRIDNLDILMNIIKKHKDDFRNADELKDLIVDIRDIYYEDSVKLLQKIKVGFEYKNADEIESIIDNARNDFKDADSLLDIIELNKYDFENIKDVIKVINKHRDFYKHIEDLMDIIDGHKDYFTNNSKSLITLQKDKDNTMKQGRKLLERPGKYILKNKFSYDFPDFLGGLNGEEEKLVLPFIDPSYFELERSLYSNIPTWNHISIPYKMQAVVDLWDKNPEEFLRDEEDPIFRKYFIDNKGNGFVYEDGKWNRRNTNSVPLNR